MKNIEKTKEAFQKMLKEIKDRKIEDFSGVGLVLYDSKYLRHIPFCPLRPSSKCPRGISISKGNMMDMLADISKRSHPWHDGYHFLNEKGELTHISQYLATPLNKNVAPNELYGTRHLSAQLGSHINGIIAIGIVNFNRNAAYFEKGKYHGLDSWDVIYKNKGKDYQYYDVVKPHSDIGKIAALFKKRKVKKVLDLGCGGGRNLLYLAKKGFELYGLDSSEEGVKMTKDSLDKENLKAELIVGDAFKKLPYETGFFDAVMSIQVLEHAKLKDIKNAIEEIKRILKPSGLIFITLCGRYSKGKVRYCIVKTAKEIEPGTFVPTLGNEIGVPHHIYNASGIRDHYRDFKITDIWRDDKDYYCFIGENKK